MVTHAGGVGEPGGTCLAGAAEVTVQCNGEDKSFAQVATGSDAVGEPTPPPVNGDGRRPLAPELEERDGLLFYRGAEPFDSLPIPDGADDEDFTWTWNDPQVQRQYTGLVVAVFRQRVWRAGVDQDAAWEAARRQPDCP